MSKKHKAGGRGKNGSEYTGIKMDRELYDQARRRAESRHQTYSEYVRQLIVRDLREVAILAPVTEVGIPV